MQLNVGVIAINRDKKKKIKHIPKIKFLSSYISCLFVTSTHICFPTKVTGELTDN